MKKLKLFFKTGFYFANIVLMIFYLYPGSILGCFFYNDCYIQPRLLYIISVRIENPGIRYGSGFLINSK